MVAGLVAKGSGRSIELTSDILVYLSRLNATNIPKLCWAWLVLPR